MGKEINYYTFAEDDYLFMKQNMEEGRISNAMTSIAQNICERYLKYIIDKFCTSEDCTNILRTHSLKRIIRFLDENLEDFKIDRTKVVLADGYYFSARYPGEESFFAKEEDVKICWEAVEETKRVVDHYLETHP